MEIEKPEWEKIKRIIKATWTYVMTYEESMGGKFFDEMRDSIKAFHSADLDTHSPEENMSILSNCDVPSEAASICSAHREYNPNCQLCRVTIKTPRQGAK